MKTSFKLILLVALWLVPSHQCRSQTIRGKVYADTEAVFAANVFLKHHTDIHTITDEDGQFELPLQDGILPDTLMVTYVGYKDFVLPLTVQNLPDSLTIKLLSNP